MGDAVDIILNKVPLEHVKDINEDKYYEMMGEMHHLLSFNLFMTAKNLGIQFRPEDFDVEQVAMFSLIHERVSKHLKDKKHVKR